MTSPSPSVVALIRPAEACGRSAIASRITHTHPHPFRVGYISIFGSPKIGGFLEDGVDCDCEGRCVLRLSRGRPLSSSWIMKGPELARPQRMLVSCQIKSSSYPGVRAACRRESRAVFPGTP